VDVIAGEAVGPVDHRVDDTFQPGVLRYERHVLEHATATEGTTTRLHIGNLATDCG